SSRRRHTRFPGDWSSDVCSSDLLRHRHQAGHALALLVLPADEIAGPLGRDEHDVEVVARLDLSKMDVEAVGEQKSGALPELAFRSEERRVGKEVRPTGAQRRDEP